MHDLAASQPKLAIIIPIFKHSGLLAEAIESVLRQRFSDGIRLILVNDGCPFAETHDVCRDYALAYPEIITYLRKANGGLSDARNCGIRHVLEYIPSAEAIYLLDADNRLRPDAMARAKSALDADPAVDWIYPNIDMFGLNWAGDYGGTYSLLIHSAMNICEAGSLIHRRVFEAGVFFDTSFKMGWEDWDFFLGAARQEFRGKNIENFGFLYRKRPESMLADSERETGALQGAMEQKHKPLFKPKSLLQLEQAEAPRYAIHLTDEQNVLHCVDPVAPGTRRLSFAEFDKEFWSSLIAPGRYRTPPINIFMTRAVMDGLTRAKLLHNILWKLETISDRNQIAALTVEGNRTGRLALSTQTDAGRSGMHRQALAVALPKQLFANVLQDQRSDWIDSMAQTMAMPPITALQLSLPEGTILSTALRQSSSTIYDLLSGVHRMRASPWRTPAQVRWGHRAAGITHRGQEHILVRQRFQNAPVFPRLEDGQRHIGFLLPLVEFGGVEKVALQMARGLRAHGWVPHAFVLETQNIALTEDWQDVFASTNLLADSSFSTWGGGAQDYLGTNVPQWAAGGQHGAVLGMLHWLDAVVNFHGGAITGVMGQLRRLGVKTLDSLHLSDMTPMGQPVGNTYLGLAYEHAFDYFVPCSHQLGNWLQGMGVPHDKIVPVQNAPGFEIAPEITAEGIAARKTRDSSEPLRVLYLGRLDRQKGLDRLARVIARAQSERLNITWRLLGKAVMAHDAPSLPPEIAAVLEPPVATPEDLAEVYAWADVVVLLSRYEGLPLTVLEAMRAGAVMIATDVGATSEMVQDGVTGVLLPEAQAVPGAVAALRRLSRDRAALRRLSEAGIEVMQSRTWAGNVEELVARLSGSSQEKSL
ncbi:glycosyltransferase [Natronohydrobacter thiooxidans]|uniref:glycosyltransferase n=1 Tax=Natronohydrobacter thiooxidans TaxID=87172 RepID=UPI0008FF1F20|nr:glycosyltransferase [Natronohydrobacter thiooxidans]